MPRPVATTLDARPPSRSLHLQIEGENRSCSLAAEQVCEKWTLTNSLLRPKDSLLCSRNSLLFLSRQFTCKALILCCILRRFFLSAAGFDQIPCSFPC